MRRSTLAALLAICCALGLVLSIEVSLAQIAPGAPEIDTATPGTTSIAIAWTAPTDTGSAAIVAYDLRYIRNDADDKTDSNWTEMEDIWSSGSLTYTITGLRRDTSFDIEVRAVNSGTSNTDGPWSDTYEASTTDHGNSKSAATTLSLGSSMEGSIDPEDDEDYYKIVAPSNTDLWVYTSGELDTTGELFRSAGTVITRNYDGRLVDHPLGFSIRRQSSSGTYFVKVTSHTGQYTGSYTIHTEAVVDPGIDPATAKTIELDSKSAGSISGHLGGSYNLDMFKFTLSASTEVWIVVAGRFDSNMILYDSTATTIATNDNSGWTFNRYASMIRRTLSMGTYYVEVLGDSGVDVGSYTLYLTEVTEPGSSQSTATPLTLNVPQTGHLSDASDRDHFSFTLDAETYVSVYVVAFENDLPIAISGLNAMTDDYTISQNDYADGNLHRGSILRWGKLAADTYNISVGTTDTTGGKYLLHVGTSRYADTEQLCTTTLDTTTSDPWFGCQWNLDNTEQFANGAGEDINVLELWDATRPVTMGEGVSVAIVDDGIDVGHVDLAENVDAASNHSFNTRGKIDNPVNTHGTAVASIIAARDNSDGVRGVAPRATVYGYDFLSGGVANTDNQNISMEPKTVDTAVSNNSWGYSTGGRLARVGTSWEEAVEKGVTTDFDGKGVLYVFSAGNGHGGGDYSNLSELTNFYAVTAVCSVNYADKRSWYSEMGSNLWVCAPSNSPGEIPELPSITTADVENRYRTNFGGTSAAAPTVSGVAALIRAADKTLSWRDVKLILANSARKNDPADSGWREGALKYGSTSDRYAFNHEYGFGMVDAGAAVALAKTWTHVPEMRQKTGTSTDQQQAIPDTSRRGTPGRTIESTLTIDNYVGFIEFVQIDINFRHTYFGDLKVELVSPSGKRSSLSVPRDVYLLNTINGSFRFGSARHLGENSAGTWKLRVADYLPGDSGILRSWSVTVYGHGITPDEPKFSSATPGDQSMTVNWQAPMDVGQSDVTKYDARVIRSDATDKSDTRWTTQIEITTTSEEITNLDPGVYYDIQLRAHNDGGAGVWSKTEQGNTDAVAPATLSTPNVTARAAELLVIWTPPGTGQVGITRYDVRYILSSATAEQKEVDTNWMEEVAWTSGGGDLTHIIDNLTNGERYDVQVRATNGQGTSEWSATRTGTPRVVNQAPTFPATETGARSIDENIRAGRNIGAAVQATDANRDPLTYDLTGSDAAHFEINKSTGQLQTMAEFDFESGRTQYLVAVEVSDNKDANGEDDPSVDATQPVTITVENVNEAPTVSGAQDFDFQEDRGNWNVGSYSASDPEMDMITWSLSGLDRGDFQIDQDGNLSFRQPPDADRPADQDRDSKYEVNVVASDGRLRGELEISVFVEEVPEAPEITGRTSIDYRENSTGVVERYTAIDPEGGTVIWSLPTNDRGTFTLTNGQLRFRSPPDHEVTDTHNLTVEASDGVLERTLPVTINITDIDEPETLTLSSDQPVENVRLTATLTEQDQVTNRRWQWARSTRRGSGYSDIPSATFSDHTPDSDDVGYYLRITLTYNDPHRADRTRTATTSRRVLAVPVNNEPPTFSPDETGQRSVDENSRHRTAIVGAVGATDPENDGLAYNIDTTHGNRFAIDRKTGLLRVGSAANLNHESRGTYPVTVSVSDPFNPAVTQQVTIMITDIDEPPLSDVRMVSTTEDSTQPVDVAPDVRDPDVTDPDESLIIRQASGPANGQLTVGMNNTFTYVPNADFDRVETITYTVSDPDLSPRVTATVYVNVTPVNDPPLFIGGPFTREVAKNAKEGGKVGKPVTANDVDEDGLTYSITGSSFFAIDTRTGQITVAATTTFDPTTTPTHFVEVIARDSSSEEARTAVAINVVERVTTTTTTGGGGGGGGGGGPPPIEIPSEEEFDWNVTRDIEELHRDNDLPTGLWSNGAVLWVVENSATGADRLFAYDLNTGERLEQHEFELERRNRFSHGIWSDGEVVWIADSGQDRLFAYQLATGERDEDRDLELDERNRDPRGIWFNGESMLVLDSVKDALFVYDLESGRLFVEFPLDKLNKSPRGIWSDGFTIWVSDDGAKRIFAYRIEGETFNRYEDQEFTFRSLLKASNGDARGIWSDGDVVFVADEQDDQVYTYNMPDAIDARLASLALSGVEFGEFSARQTEYAAVVEASLPFTTVEAEAAQSKASIEIMPADADGDPTNGHQAALIDGLDITVAVTSEDGSRRLAYTVGISNCLSGLSETRLNSVQFVGGSVGALLDCARSLGVDALYHYRDGVWVAFFLDAPAFLNHAFRNRFAEGVLAGEVLIAKREPVRITTPAVPSPG